MTYDQVEKRINETDNQLMLIHNGKLKVHDNTRRNLVTYRQDLADIRERLHKQKRAEELKPRCEL